MKFPQKHHSLKYIASRIALAIFQKRNPQLPWLVRTALPFIEQRLKPGATGIEWGSGRSTAWFAERAAHVTTVEDDSAWVEIVKDSLNRQGLASKVDIRQIALSDETGYPGVATEFAPSSVDFVLVDGSRQRGECSIAGIGLVREGGMFILDNAERYLDSPEAQKLHGYMQGGERNDPSWDQLRLVLSRWACSWFSDGTTATMVAIRPAAG